MAMLPTVFGDNIFDDFFADPFFRAAGVDNAQPTRAMQPNPMTLTPWTWICPATTRMTFRSI